MADASQLYEKAIKFTERQLNLLREEISQKESGKSNHGGQNGSIPDVDSMMQKIGFDSNNLKNDLEGKINLKADSSRFDNFNKKSIALDDSTIRSGMYCCPFSSDGYLDRFGNLTISYPNVSHQQILRLYAISSSGMTMEIRAIQNSDRTWMVDETGLYDINHMLEMGESVGYGIQTLGYSVDTVQTVENAVDSKIDEAPNDSKSYVRKNKSWEEFVAGGAVITASSYQEITNPSESSLYKFTTNTPVAYGNPVNKTTVLWRPVIESGVTKWVPCQPLIYSASPTFDKTMIPAGKWGPFITCLASQTLIEYISIESWISYRYTETIASTKTSTTL